MDNFINYSFVPAPLSIFQGVNKLEQAHILELDVENERITKHQYWNGKNCDYAKVVDSEEPEETLNFLLNEAVKLQMVADVPIGVFLSGGIDSTLVAAIMQSHSSKPVNSYTIGFEEKEYDEAKQAKNVASIIGTKHNELVLSPRDLLDVLPLLPSLYDEPFADSSQIPTFLVSKFASRDVKVCLSGDGGDELFGGYNRHVFVNSYWKKLSNTPTTVRKLLANLLEVVPADHWQTYALAFTRLLNSKNAWRLPSEKVEKIISALRAEGLDDLYFNLTRRDSNENILLTTKNVESKKRVYSKFMSGAKNFMYWDQIDYLPNDILTKVDRASMGVSLETRAPLLDYRIVELSRAMEDKHFFGASGGKQILRRILKGYTGTDYKETPKMGFGVPIDKWFRNELRELTHDFLNKSMIKRQNIFCHDSLMNVWEQHQSGTKNRHHLLWNFIVFQLWFEKYTDERPV